VHLRCGLQPHFNRGTALRECRRSNYQTYQQHRTQVSSDDEQDFETALSAAQAAIVRVLGIAHMPLEQVNGYPAQLFEKGCIEDHRQDTIHPDWTFIYMRLTDELMTSHPAVAVSGTSVTYGDLAAAARPGKRRKSASLVGLPGLRFFKNHMSSLHNNKWTILFCCARHCCCQANQ
jgi:hypothetical protein